LRVMDMVDVSQPIEDVRSYLLVRYESRKEMHPRLFELTVSDVFKDFGYKAEATAYGKDGGVDVVLVGPNDATVAIQVKRYRAAIEVENIRAFAGAMVLRGYTKGIFVTTSRFQSGAATAVEGYMDKGIGIELVDSERFFQMLRMKRRNPFLDYEAWASEFGELSDFEMGNIYKSATGRNP
jgi:restriction system protein